MSVLAVQPSSHVFDASGRVRLRHSTLGDVTSTGTPLSVAFGRERYPKDGDVVKAEIEAIGTLMNPMKNEAWKKQPAFTTR